MRTAGAQYGSLNGTAGSANNCRYAHIANLQCPFPNGRDPSGGAGHSRFARFAGAAGASGNNPYRPPGAAGSPQYSSPQYSNPKHGSDSAVRKHPNSHHPRGAADGPTATSGPACPARNHPGYRHDDSNRPGPAVLRVTASTTGCVRHRQDQSHVHQHRLAPDICPG